MEMGRHYHLCFTVQDIDAACRELTDTLGIGWSPIRDGSLDEWDYRIVFSVDGPPFLELIQGPPGSPWDASTGSRFDHLGFWVDDIGADKRALADQGAPLDFDATALGRSFTYHRLESVGGRVELVDRSVQPDFVQTWAPQLAVMPTLRIGAPAAPAGPPAGTSPEGIMVCRATLIEFLSAIDHGRATDALDLFTDDASFAARGQQLQGRPAIAGFLQERQAEASRHTVHVLSNEIVRSATADRLELTATLLLHEREPDGHYAIHRALNTTQSFHRHHDRWRIHTRSTQPIHPPPT
jgi:hypothetical protein